MPLDFDWTKDDSSSQPERKKVDVPSGVYFARLFYVNMKDTDEYPTISFGFEIWGGPYNNAPIWENVRVTPGDKWKLDKKFAAVGGVEYSPMDIPKILETMVSGEYKIKVNAKPWSANGKSGMNYYVDILEKADFNEVARSGGSPADTSHEITGEIPF